MTGWPRESDPAPPPLSQSKLHRAARNAKTALLRPVRRGSRLILFPSPNARLGNLLYLWMHAWLDQRSGRDTRVLITPSTQPWLDCFPRIASDLLVRRNEVRLTDQRTSGAYQAFGVHYTREELELFCSTYLQHTPLSDRFADRLRAVEDPQNVTINIRRGDYYSVDKHRDRYGFDIVGYVAQALAAQERHAPVSRIHVVSDDLNWCLDNVEVGAREVQWFADRGPELDFATLCASRRLILTNSTFSYWGGYVSQVRFADAHVVAPLFHARGWLDGRSFHLHPSWVSLPGWGEDLSPADG